MYPICGTEKMELRSDVDGYLNTVPNYELSFAIMPITGKPRRPEFYENLGDYFAAHGRQEPFWAFALATAHQSLSCSTLALFVISI